MAASAPQRPGGPSPFGEPSRRLDDWLRIEPDGTVTAFSGKVEVGTGVRTALAQIVAEELDVPLERIRMVMGDTDLTPDEGYTAGSMTLRSSGGMLRQAAAEARRALLEAASDRLDAAVDELAVRDGVIVVTHHPGRTVSYAELMGGRRFNLEVTGSAPLKPPEAYRIVGTPAPRADVARKLRGEPTFIQDVRVPGMLHGRVVFPPGPGAQLAALDESSVRSAPGLVQVVRRGNFVGVVAEREEQAVRAAQLKVEWRTPDTLPRMEDLYAALRASAAEDQELVATGDPAALGQAARRVEAVYHQPFHAHASLGPSCAVADATADPMQVWSSTPGPYPLRGALAQLLDVPPERLHVIHVEGAGGYGHNGSDDAAADALLLSQAVGRPVRVQWSREHEFAWEPKAAAMVIELRAGLDADGRVTAWEREAWSPTHAARPRLAAQFLAAQWMAGQNPPPAQFFMGAERNAATNYTFLNQRAILHWVPNPPLRTSSFRSLGAAGNTFANESFMDELAAEAGADPLEFRLRHLDDPRARAVLNAAAEQAGWQVRPARKAAEPGAARTGLLEGRGLAFIQYKTSEAYVATVAHVAVDAGNGAVRVTRIVVAHDCGLIVNPDGLANQIEGNVIQSLSRALKEEVRFDTRRVTSLDWQAYPILTFSEAPAVDVVLLDRPDEPAVGAGEPAQVPTAAAVANAICDAAGVRLRQAPFTPERVRAALEESEYKQAIGARRRPP
jgi:nicotinate dehydrogenase subunit B